MNILILGFGTNGKFYFDILKKNKKIKKIFICNDLKLPKNSKYTQMDFDIKRIQKENIKSAIVCTPSNLHYKFSKILLNKSINLLIEKPFVLKLDHANDLIDLSQKKKVKCWVAFQNRCNLALQKAKKIVSNKKLGQVFLVDCSLYWKRDFNYYRVSWRGKYKSDGGVLANQAIHLLDAILYIFGRIKNFNGMIRFNKKKLEAEDLIALSFEHNNGIITNFKATTRADSNYISAMDILGEKGRVVIDGISLNNFITLTNNKKKKDKKNSENFSTKAGSTGAMGSGHKKILAEFLNNSLKKSSFDLEIHKNLHSLEVIHSVYNYSNIRNYFTKVKNKQSKLGI